eukprot:CAMPEP_0182847906 /NCGR_PEP_ID=MMETSP0006_2-20121128/28714_1 /TAXON_ID=97485 /ORGANISM="Prymnesium parvum, Strain Texoma1" /LENGTH=131 /DNA_ID=CAMNT_0024978283 /DNA_START=447 /DNA_END=842 /DNA_ORIENTATION=-
MLLHEAATPIQSFQAACFEEREPRLFWHLSHRGDLFCLLVQPLLPLLGRERARHLHYLHWHSQPGFLAEHHAEEVARPSGVEIGGDDDHPHPRRAELLHVLAAHESFVHHVLRGQAWPQRHLWNAGLDEQV